MRRIDRRLVFMAVSVLALFGLYGDATREFKTEERISETSSKWIYFKGIKLKNCVKKQETSECLRYKNLELAQLACEANESCNGITEFAGDSFSFYELREGPEIVELETNSWILSCDDSNESFTFVDPKDLEDEYPELKKQRMKNSNNECVYFGKYSYLNTLLKFDPALNPVALESPPACSDEDFVFGIKEESNRKNCHF